MLSDKIHELRLAKGVSQVEMAKALSVTKQSISNWENNNIQPSVEIVMKLADYFGTSTDFLLGRTEIKTLNVDGLTQEQIQHLKWIIDDLCD